MKGEEHLDREAWVKDAQRLQVEEGLEAGWKCRARPGGLQLRAEGCGLWPVTWGQRACSSGGFVTR